MTVHLLVRGIKQEISPENYTLFLSFLSLKYQVDMIFYFLPLRIVIVFIYVSSPLFSPLTQHIRFVSPFAK